MRHAMRSLVLALVLLAPAALAQSTQETTATGFRVDFTLTPFNDTLFTAVDAAFRVRFDDDRHVWYTTEGGLVHVDPANQSRELFTKMEGLPSSYSLGLWTQGTKVYVATDLGLAVLDRTTGAVQQVTMANSSLPDAIVQEVVVIGDDVWMGTRFFGVAVWNSTKPASDPTAWTLKNTSTTAGYAKAVRRIVASDAAVYAATEGDGLWRYDRASRQWNVTIMDDGLVSNTVLSVVERGPDLWVGTDKGLQRRAPDGAWTRWNVSRGMPDDRVLDLDVIPTANGTLDVFAATRKGIFQLDVGTGKSAVRAQSFGILGAYVFDEVFVEGKGWAFATNRGVSLKRGGDWDYYSTGASDGPSWGPLSYGFTSASVGDQEGYLWFGSVEGLSAYRLPTATRPGHWQNFGEWQDYPGSVVNWIDTDGNRTWFATNQGAYGFAHDSGRWISKVAVNSRNLVYGLEADRDELWVALFGDGLIMTNLTTGITRAWDYTTAGNPIPDQFLTDVRAEGDTMWLGASVGVIRMDRLTGTFRGTYTKADGIPGDGVVFRLVPEGPTVWVGTKTGGVAQMDVASGKVVRTWNATTTPGFPDGQVRALHREGGRLWVGTTEGLARIDVATGGFRVWTQAQSGLVQNYVNGITSADGLLYLATLSGVARMDIATGEFLPMRDGPGVVRGAPTAGGGAEGTRSLSVRIDAPRAGVAVTGPTEIRGTTLAFGVEPERVEVRVNDGAWQAATGTSPWSFAWDADAHPANAPVVIAARAVAGDLVSREAEITVTPVAAPKVPLAIEEVPAGDAVAGRPFPLAARVEGDEPLSATLFYKLPDAASYERLSMTRAGSLYTATIPAKHVKEGELRYYFEAQSGLLVATAAGDANAPSVLTVAPAPRLAIAIVAPDGIVARAGVSTDVPLTVRNEGTQPVRVDVEATGLRASWLALDARGVQLAPEESRVVLAKLNVPAAAFADNVTLTFAARDAAGEAEPASATVPVQVLASSVAVATPTSGPKGVPFPPVVALAAVALALVLRRRRL